MEEGDAAQQRPIEPLEREKMAAGIIASINANLFWPDADVQRDVLRRALRQVDDMEAIMAGEPISRRKASEEAASSPSVYPREPQPKPPEAA